MLGYFVITQMHSRAIPASALDEDDEDDEDADEVVGETRDDERSGTRYNVSSLNGLAAVFSPNSSS